jgi:hypothetical protein
MGTKSGSFARTVGRGSGSSGSIDSSVRARRTACPPRRRALVAYETVSLTVHCSMLRAYFRSAEQTEPNIEERRI